MSINPFEYNEDDIPLMEYGNIFAANTLWLRSGKDNQIATFEMTIRDLPKNWGYFLMFGLDRYLHHVKNFHFSEENLNILEKLGYIGEKEKEYYSKLRFTGEIWAIPDGTAFFPNEPIIRITAPLIEANLLTALTLNVFSYPIRALTKVSRGKIASLDKRFAAGAAIRAQGLEQVPIILDAGYIAYGGDAIQPIFQKKHPELINENNSMPNINHAVIKSFDSEREVFQLALKECLPTLPSISFMVDTYNLKKGLATLIEEIKKVDKNYYKKISVVVDSGDVLKTAQYIRKTLNANLLNEVKITAMSNLDEYKIDELEKNNSPINTYIAVTEVTNITDAPKLEMVYKMTQIVKKNGEVSYKAKLAKGKESYPGKKQIFRVKNKEGKMLKDIIGLEDENLGERLLQLVMKNGEILSKEDIHSKRALAKKSLDSLSNEIKKTYSTKKAPVEISPKLAKLFKETKKKHLTL